MTRPLWAMLGLAFLLAGCAGGQVLTGTGHADKKPYLDRGVNQAAASELARRDAALQAQDQLVREYAGRFLPTQTEIDRYASLVNKKVSVTYGLLRGVTVTRVEERPDGSSCTVEVQAALKELTESLGQGPEPAVIFTYPIIWPKAAARSPTPPAP